jgi:hypothetical protein
MSCQDHRGATSVVGPNKGDVGPTNTVGPTICDVGPTPTFQDGIAADTRNYPPSLTGRLKNADGDGANDGGYKDFFLNQTGCQTRLRQSGIIDREKFDFVD